MSTADELAKLSQLRNDGALTDEEFSRAKEQLLSQPRQDGSGPLHKISKKSALIIAHVIIWGCAILATGIALRGSARSGVIIAILTGSAGVSLVILTSKPTSLE